MNDLKMKNKDSLGEIKGAATGRILDKILDYAVAEDIDEMILESSSGRGSVRFYDAGEIKGRLAFDSSIKGDFFSSLEKLACLSKSGSVRSGGFKKDFAGVRVVFSVSAYGTKEEPRFIVSLNHDDFQVLGLGQLGFEKAVSGRVKAVLEEGKGLVLIVGPFNSGKTTTLYSFINHINSSEINVATFEDDISADLPSVNQSRLSGQKGAGRLPALSFILRQDPDVVMLDELVDRDGIEAALHLADRGYFVLAGLYGRNLCSTLDFLQGLGVPLPLFASSVKMIINQRLVNRNCPFCLEKVRLGRESARRLKRAFPGKNLFDAWREEKIVGSEFESLEDASFYRSRGCDKCRQKGLSGKVAVFEVLSMDKEMASSIKTGHFSSLKLQPEKQGTFSLAESALIKAMAGLIPLEEVFKIAEEDSI